MLLQTNSYIVPKEKRTEHARLLQRFKQLLAKHGCDHFEAYEQVGANWSGAEPSGRFVQIMRFRDRQHWLSVQQEEKNDPQAKQLIAEFCELINLPYQMQAGLFSAVYFNGVITQNVARPPKAVPAPEGTAALAGVAALGGAAATVAADVNEDAAITQVLETPEAHVDTPEEIADAPMATPPELPDEPPLTDESTALDELAAASDRNGESDVLDFLTDAEPAPQQESGRQRTD